MTLFNICRFYMYFWRIFFKNNFGEAAMQQPYFFFKNSPPIYPLLTHTDGCADKRTDRHKCKKIPLPFISESYNYKVKRSKC